MSAIDAIVFFRSTFIRGTRINAYEVPTFHVKNYFKIVLSIFVALDRNMSIIHFHVLNLEKSHRIIEK